MPSKLEMLAELAKKGISLTKGSPATGRVQALSSKLSDPARTQVLPMPNRWFLSPEKFPHVQPLVEKVLKENNMQRGDFFSGAFVDPKTGKILDFNVMKDVGVVIDPVTNRPKMSGLESGVGSFLDIPETMGPQTKSNLVRKGLFKSVGGDPLLNDINFLATVERSGAGHQYGLGTEYATPTEMLNTMTGDNPTLRPHSRGDLFGVGDVVGQIVTPQGKPTDVYESLLIAPKGSDVEGVRLHKKAVGGNVSQDAMHMAVMNQKVQKKAEGSSADDFELKRSAAGSVMPLEGEIEAAMRAATVNPLLARQAARRRGEFVPEAPQMPVEEPQATIKPYDPTFRQKMAGLIERGLRNVSPADRARAIAQEGIMGVGGLGVADFVPFIGTGMALQETKRGIEEARREGKPEEAWAELLGGVAAAAPGIGPTVKMAKPVSKALANEAAYRIYQAMERGEGPLAGALAGVRPLKIDVWHGSPHLFQPTTKNLLGEFDPKKIGTGEGNQAFGYGHYLAEKPGTSKTYKRMESEYKRMTQGFEPKVEYAYDLMSKGLDDAKVLDNFAYKYGSQFSFDDAMKAIKEAREHINAGYLYKVNLPDEHISKMLDWDKPLSQQPEVIKALKGTDYEVGLSQKEAEKIADARLRDEAQEWADETGGDPIDYFNNVDWEKYVDNIRKESGNIDSNITGRELHSIIMRDEGYRPELFDPENYQIPTSETLRSYGIPGIRYLDAASRGTGEGTRNFVVFPGNEHMINIVGREKEGGVIRKAEGGITSDDLIIEENPL